MHATSNLQDSRKSYVVLCADRPVCSVIPESKVMLFLKETKSATLNIFRFFFFFLFKSFVKVE